MPLIQKFRIDNERPEKDWLEFYIKINNDSGQKLLNLCVAGDGLYYYRPGSQILSPKENRKTRNTYDGYLSMAKVKEIFEKLAKAGWTRRDEENGEVKIRASQKGNKVILEVIEID